jgi:hypothetical protein
VLFKIRGGLRGRVAMILLVLAMCRGRWFNQHTAMSLLAVYGCVNLISDSIATMPVHSVGGASPAVAVVVGVSES